MTRERVSTERMGGPGGWAQKYTARLWLSDAVVLATVMLLAHSVRFGWDPLARVAGPSAPGYAWVTVGISALWVLELKWGRTHEARILGHGPQEFQRIVNASWRTLAIVAVLGFLTQWQISRGYLLFAIPLGTVGLLLTRAAWRQWIHGQRDRGELQAQVLVVGPRRTTEQMIRRLRSSRRAGYNVIGVCVPGDESGPLSEDLADIPVLGCCEDAADRAAAIGAEYLLLSGTDSMSLQETRRLGWELEGSGIGLIVLPAMADVAGPRVRMSPVDGLPLMHVDAPDFTGGKYVLKNTFDRIGAALALAVLSVPMLVIALAVRLTSTGPALFTQVRVGRDHQLFTMYKFRTMYEGADARHDEVFAAHVADAGNEVLQKLRHDPRVTPVGQFLRKYSLDELPQLLNTLKGDMSLVGPRPPLPSEVNRWDAAEHVERRQLVKPGITGLWQVSGRSDLSWSQSVRLDLYYAENWSLGGDIVIVFRTLWAVFVGRGAY